MRARYTAPRARRFFLAAAVLLAALLLTALGACGKSYPEPPEEQEIAERFEAFLQPQVEAYRQGLGLDELDVKVQIKKVKNITPAGKEGDGVVSVQVRDLLVCDPIAAQFAKGDFSDELLKKLSAVKFDYSGFEEEGYCYFGDSALLYPILLDGSVEYTISEGVVLRGETIAYISEDAELDVNEAHVGENINDVLDRDIAATPKSVCPNCNGTGYVKYYYGSSDLEAVLSGYDPYSVGQCQMCHGKGH